MNTGFARGLCRRAENATSSTEAQAERCGRAYAAPVSAAVVVRRAPYQWTPATRSRSAFIHDGRVNGVRVRRPRLAAGGTHVREKMARRRDGKGRRAKSAGRTSVVMAGGASAGVRVGAEARRGASRQPAAPSRCRSPLSLRADSRSTFGRYALRCRRVTDPGDRFEDATISWVARALP